MIDIYTHRQGEGLTHTQNADVLPGLLEDRDRTTWVDLEEPTPDETVLLESVFHFHPLAIEDCIHGRSLPKIDVFDSYLFLVVQGVLLDRKRHDFASTNLSVFLGPNYLVTYHHQPVLSVRSTKGLLAKSDNVLSRGADFLLHTSLDFLVDNYQPLLDEMDEIIGSIEERIVTTDGKGVLKEILEFKRTLHRLRRVASYQKEILNRLSREEFALVAPGLRIYYRDVFDHLVRVTDLAESYKDMLASALEAYLAIVNNRMNEVMKLLTVFSTILLPLTLIASIYGMNFRRLPLAEWSYGFEITLGIMIAISVGMLVYFRRRRWI